MKRLSPLVLFFYVCAFVQPPQTKANPVIGILVPGVIGATIIGIAGTQYALQNPDSSFEFDGGTLGKAVWAYKAVQLAGKDYLLGKAARATLDLEAAWNQGALLGKAAIQAIANTIWPTSGQFPAVGDTVAPSTGLCTSNKTITNIGSIFVSSRTAFTDAPCAYGSIWCYNNGNCYMDVGPYPENTTYENWRQVQTQTTDEPATWPASGPPLLSLLPKLRL